VGRPFARRGDVGVGFGFCPITHATCIDWNHVALLPASYHPRLRSALLDDLAAAKVEHLRRVEPANVALSLEENLALQPPQLPLLFLLLLFFSNHCAGSDADAVPGTHP